MKKLIKLSETHYIIVDESKIKDGEWFYNTFNDNQAKIQQRKGNWKNCFNEHKITHSTQILELITNSGYSAPYKTSYKKISLSEVEEVINGYSVEKMAEREFPSDVNDFTDNGYDTKEIVRIAYVEGFKAHQELTKDKLFTVDEILYIASKSYGLKHWSIDKFKNRLIESLLPKTEWEVEFVDGKLTLV